MIEIIIRTFAALLQELSTAGQDKGRQQDALMRAEEKLSHARMKVKAG